MSKIIFTDNQSLILEYVRTNPGVNVEDVLNFLVPFDHADDLMQDMAKEVGWLIANDYLEKNPRNYGLTVREIPADTSRKEGMYGCPKCQRIGNSTVCPNCSSKCYPLPPEA